MKIIRLGFLLLFISAVAGACLSFVYFTTNKKIIEVVKDKIYQMQKEILPLAVTFDETDGGLIKIGYDGNKAEVGKIVSVSPKGYAGSIDMLVGMDTNKTVTAVKIVKHFETPGLGANITKDSFLSQFCYKKLDQIVLKKDNPAGMIDGITGATISSRAVVNGVKNASTMIANP